MLATCCAAKARAQSDALPGCSLHVVWLLVDGMCSGVAACQAVRLFDGRRGWLLPESSAAC